MASQQPIFRFVEVGTGQRLTLGEPVPADVLPLTEPAGANKLKMKAHTFGGASEIVIQLSPAETVRDVTFAYAAGTDYDAMVNQFTDELGTPESQNNQLTRWRDDQTTFQVTQQASAVGSLLADRAGETAA
ncbi:MAG TPA: hypothetical protein VF665_22665 [Longimicrobium sp.]|jgi:hypothetical protein|uniref:hypothetical protein n=1 Tax=Longimicrobium sp. TaxID=2029185 RepID=UPI002ED794AC